jgi:hypothetical protein
MAHVLTTTVNPELIADAHDAGTVADDAIISDEAIAIHERFTAEGKIVDVTETDNGDGTYQSVIKFVDSAACDAYLAEMAEINEFETSGASRSNQTRQDI